MARFDPSLTSNPPPASPLCLYLNLIQRDLLFLIKKKKLFCLSSSNQLIVPLLVVEQAIERTLLKIDPLYFLSCGILHTSNRDAVTKVIQSHCLPWICNVLLLCINQ